MNIQEQILHTTLHIEMLDNTGKVMGGGTGFLVSVPVDDGGVKVILVSNKHVLMATDNIAVTFTKMSNGNAEFGKSVRLPIGNLRGSIVAHPNPQVDIAAVVCTGLFNLFPDQLYFKAIPMDMLADFTEEELSIAENVYFVGYPDDRYDVVNNLPLIRSGLIASDPKRDYNGLPVFVIDAQVFPGSSGSPVYINFTYENMKNGSFVIGGQPKVKVLGIVAQTMVRNNRLQAINVNTMLVAQEVLGLGIVFKSPAIVETIRLALSKA